MSSKTVALVAVFLAAIVAANLLVSEFGPEASIYNAFFLIGLDLTTRDALHDAWGRHRWRNMALLIAAGSLLSWLVDRDAGTIALASAAAFAAAGTADLIVYHLARRRPWLERANTSNLFGAAVDSIVFPTIAFGGLLWGVTFGQFCAKVAGGFLFALLIAYTLKRREAVA